jgi:hypothetical protein
VPFLCYKPGNIVQRHAIFKQDRLLNVELEVMIPDEAEQVIISWRHQTMDTLTEPCFRVFNFKGAPASDRSGLCTAAGDPIWSCGQAVRAVPTINGGSVTSERQKNDNERGGTSAAVVLRSKLNQCWARSAVLYEARCFFRSSR